MSYILDALRRADAERGRGGVPSIHTQQQFTPLGADDERELPRARRIGWIAGGLGVALIGAVAWMLIRPEPAPPVATSSAVQPRAVTPLPNNAPSTVEFVSESALSNCDMPFADPKSPKLMSIF